jgi:hypothetical protein
MGLFSSKPKLETCFFCSELVAEGIATRNHYETHLIQVTDNNGHQAYTFNCPRCGLMDQAWGGGRSDPKGSALSALYLHLAQRHGRHDLLR